MAPPLQAVLGSALGRNTVHALKCRWKPERVELLLEHMARSGADVVCLQEVRKKPKTRSDRFSRWQP